MPHDFMPGLAGIPAAKSAVSDVDGQRGILEYRGIRIEELCAQSSFIETTYLLLFGRLPTAPELARFTDDVSHKRRIKFRIVDLLKCLPENGHPMDALQAAVAALPQIPVDPPRRPHKNPPGFPGLGAPMDVTRPVPGRRFVVGRAKGP